ncbi:MAG: helix-turn-helix transcriptional regulator [Alloprevotella sp.]|nr:helix-turn-helix transcriptional regulator [Alloprevotella sp.]
MELKDRIHFLMEQLNLSQRDFAGRLGISPSSLSTIFTGRTNPTFKHVQAIHKSFPQISLYWLQFGEGEMYVDGSGVTVENDGANAGENDFSAGSPIVSDEGVGGMAEPADDMLFSLDSAEPFATVAEPVHKVAAPSYSGVGAAVEPVGVQVAAKAKIKEIRVFFDDGTYESFTPTAE